MTNPITDRQREVFEFIVSFRDERGYPPTIGEISIHFGLQHRNGIVCHLKALVAKGYIERDKMVSRGIRIPVRFEAGAK